MNAGRVNAARTTALRLPVAICALAAAAGCIAASLLTWLALPDGAGGRTFVSGWGTVSGGSQIAGENINDAMDGNATFRPGLFPLLIGAFALLAALGIALVARGPRPHRIPAAVLVLCGAAALAWGIVRIASPDSLDLPGPTGSAGAGPWLTAGSGVVLLAVAVVVLLGLLDPPPPLRRRGTRSANR